MFWNLGVGINSKASFLHESSWCSFIYFLKPSIDLGVVIYSLLNKEEMYHAHPCASMVTSLQETVQAQPYPSTQSGAVTVVSHHFGYFRVVTRELWILYGLIITTHCSLNSIEVNKIVSSWQVDGFTAGWDEIIQGLISFSHLLEMLPRVWRGVLHLK